MPVILALWRLRQEDGEFKARLGYRVRLTQEKVVTGIGRNFVGVK